jgi:hypothetical protein
MSSLGEWLMLKVHGARPVHRRRPRRSRRCSPARNYRYKAWIRTLPSAVSGQLGCEAAHTGSDGGMSMKSSDYSCIPLTFAEHAEYHRIGRGAFEQRFAIDCRAIVKRLNHAWFAYAQEVK